MLQRNPPEAVRPSPWSTPPRLIVAVAVALTLLAGCRSTTTEAEDEDPQPMNVLFIIIDTLRTDHVGSYGYERDTTPNLDLLELESARFERAYSHSPWTMPSIASIWTSQDPKQHGLAVWRDVLGEQHVTLAEVLQENGYRTEAVVSHDIIVAKYGFGQGFDVYDSSALRLGKSLQIKSSEHVTDCGIEALDRAGDEPFFLAMHYFDPHKRYLQHEEFRFGRFKMDRYDAEIAYTDHHIGRLLDHLTLAGKADDTIVVVIADHGEEFKDHGGRLHGWKLYDEVVWIPLLIKVPGFEPQLVDTVVTESDVAPTLLQLLDIPIPPSFHGQPFAVEEDHFVVRDDRTVYLETYFMGEVCKRGVLHDDHKLIHDCNNDHWSMFDMVRDPGGSRTCSTTPIWARWPSTRPPRPGTRRCGRCCWRTTPWTPPSPACGSSPRRRRSACAAWATSTERPGRRRPRADQR